MKAKCQVELKASISVQVIFYPSPQYDHLFFQLNIQFFNYSNQDIKFGLLCDNVMIGNVSSNYQNGVYEATIYGTYQNSIFDRIKTELFIDPKLNKQLKMNFVPFKQKMNITSAIYLTINCFIRI